jgi:hypothetical protein
MRFHKFIYILLWLVLISCNHNKTTPELIEIFNSNKKALGLVIDKFQKDKKLDTLFEVDADLGPPKIENSYSDIPLIFKEVGIAGASSCKNSFPKGTRWYYFKTNWPNEFPIYLIFNAHNSYDSSEFEKGFYSKDEVSNETWGLGHRWKMFRLVKERTMKQ